MAAPQDRLGQQMGEYRLYRLLGKGAFGAVYQAEHVHDGTQAAVKLLQVQLAQPEDFKAFLNEARAIRLRHPHIVPLLDFGLDGENQPFLAMEYAEGGTLRDRHPKGSRLPLPTLVSYVQQVASALQYAHEHRVIHRDVKPENILVRADGSLLLSDFGIATVVHSSHSINLQQGIGGTLPYMAPEQIQGKPRPASDQYALAIVVYEWISGQRPFQGTAVEMAMQHAMTAPPSLLELVPTLPGDVEQVVLKALAKDPKERWPSVQVFARALQAAVAHQSLVDSESAGTSRGSVGGVPTSSMAASLDGVSLTVQSNEPHILATPPKVSSAEMVTSVPSPTTYLATDGRAAAQAPLSVAQGKKPLPSVPITPGFLPARIHLPARWAMVLALLVLLVGSGGIWATLYVTTHHPTTPTATTNIFQMTAVVGHNDSATSPSIFFAFDLQGRATILELPGGDPAYSRIYVGPLLSGSNVSVTLRFQKVTGNSLPDMIVYADQDIKIFGNNGKLFSPVPSSQVPQNKVPGPTSSNANYPLSWTSAVVGHDDSAQKPSHFIAMNLNGQVVVIEFKGGDPSKAVTYVVPVHIVGNGGDQVPVTLEFRDVTGNGKPDMLVHMHLQKQDQLYVFINTGTGFRPANGNDKIHVTATSDVHLTPTPSGTKATGYVTFTNQGSVSLIIFTGTLVATLSGILFETTAELQLAPSESFPVPVQASKPDATGNVPANSITVIPQQSLQTLAQYNNLPLANLHLTVTNDSPTTGGGR